MEIEVKAKLKNKEAVLAALTARGCRFSDAKTQRDTVWVAETGSLETYHSNSVFLRIRIQDGGRIVLTAKSPKGKEGNDALVKREHEVLIDSAEEARNILAMLGLKEAVSVVKSRRRGHCEGYEVCLDDVEGLGSFVELEKMAEEHEAAGIQKGMMEFLVSLGVIPEDQVKKGYDILMLEAQQKK